MAHGLWPPKVQDPAFGPSATQVRIVSGITNHSNLTPLEHSFPASGSGLNGSDENEMIVEDSVSTLLTTEPMFYNPIFHEILQKSDSKANSILDTSDTKKRDARLPQRRESGAFDRPNKWSITSPLLGGGPLGNFFRHGDPALSPFGLRLKQQAKVIKEFQTNPVFTAKTLLEEGNQKFLDQFMKTIKRAENVPREVTEMTLAMLLRRLLRPKHADAEDEGSNSDTDIDSEDEDLDEYLLNGWLSDDYKREFMTTIDEVQFQRNSSGSPSNVLLSGIKSTISSLCAFFTRKSDLEPESVTIVKEAFPSSSGEMFLKRPEVTTSRDTWNERDKQKGTESRVKRHSQFLALLQLAGIQPLPPHLIAPIKLHKSKAHLSLTSSLAENEPFREIIQDKSDLHLKAKSLRSSSKCQINGDDVANNNKKESETEFLLPPTKSHADNGGSDTRTWTIAQ